MLKCPKHCCNIDNSKSQRAFLRFQYTLGQSTDKRVQNIAVICRIVDLSPLFIILGKFHLQKVFLSNI